MGFERKQRWKILDLQIVWRTAPFEICFLFVCFLFWITPPIIPSHRDQQPQWLQDSERFCLQQEEHPPPQTCVQISVKHCHETHWGGWEPILR